MKTITLYFYLFFITTSTLSAQSLTGAWEGKTEGEAMEFVFDKEGYASMKSEGEITGGKRYKSGGSYYSMKYLLQKEGKVRNLDFIVYDDKTNKEVRKMLCIVEWISENQIRLCFNTEELVRPKDFKDKDDVIVLTRK